MTVSQNPSVRRGVLIRWLTFFSLAIGGTVADLWSKAYVFNWLGLPGESAPFWFIDSYLGIQTAVNPGALFGMGAGWGSLFAIAAIFAALAIFIWLTVFRGIESWWLVIALGLVIGGIFGNLYDRLGLWNPPAHIPEYQTGVRDWILFRVEGIRWLDPWPNFNIADSLLVGGAIMLAIHSFFFGNEAESSKKLDGQSSNLKS